MLKRRREVLFRPSPAELVAPVELKVLGWKKGGRNGVVIKGAGGPGGDGIRGGGRVPWGAEVEYAYTTGYDSHGRVSVNHIMDERGCSALLEQPHSTRLRFRSGPRLNVRHGPAIVSVVRGYCTGKSPTRAYRNPILATVSLRRTSISPSK